MSRRRFQRLASGSWPWWKRLAIWAYGFLVGPFLTKLKDGTVMGSMTRWAVALFTVAEFRRLSVAPVGAVSYAEAFLAFVILFALPIDGALSKAPPEVVVKAVTGMGGKQEEGGTTVVDGASVYMEGK